MLIAAFLSFRFLLRPSPPVLFVLSFSFPIFLVKAAIAMFALANFAERSTIVLIKKVMVLRSDKAAKTKFVSACCVSLFTASCASARSAASHLHVFAYPPVLSVLADSRTSLKALLKWVLKFTHVFVLAAFILQSRQSS